MSGYVEVSEFDAQLVTAIMKLEKQGLIEIEGGKVRLTHEGYEELSKDEPDEERLRLLGLSRDRGLPSELFVERFIERAEEEVETPS